MSFAQEMKEFVSAAQAGWKMMTPTSAEVNAAALRESIAENKRRAAEMKKGGTGGDEPARTVSGGGGGEEDSSDYSGASNDPVAEDLEGHQKALLNAISGPESAGRYNIRYGGVDSKGKPFEETGEHPAVPEKTRSGQKSTAAGRYQFTKTTWNDVTGGNVPFTRANQDIYALKLAQRDYEARTGRDLDKDLKTQGLTSGILRALAPTWEGFKSGEGRGKALSIYRASLNRYSGDTSTKAGMPQPDTSEEPPEAPPTRSAVTVPQPPVRPASVTPGAIPIRRVRTTPASAVSVDQPVAIDAATGQPIPPGDPRINPDIQSRPVVPGRTSAIINPLLEEDPYLRSGIYAARGGLVPSYAGGGAVDLDQEELGGAVDDDDDVTPARAQADFAAIRSMGDNPLAYIAYAANKGLHQIQDRFGLNSGAVPAESPRAQDGARALAANAGAPDPAMVKQLQDTADPSGKMSPDQRAIHGWGNLIKYYTEQGNPQAVANAGAAMLMHSKRVSQQAGALALAAIEKGDYQSAAKAVQAAYNTFPNGQSIRVNTAGEDGIEYSVVTAGGGVGKNGKITPEELKEVATGMLNGSQWFQHAMQLTNMPAAKPADIAKKQQIKAIQAFEEKVPEDARGVEDLDKDLRKSWANLPSPYRREQEKKWRDLKKQDKTESEQTAEAEYVTGDAKDDFLASRTEDQMAAYLKMSDKGKARAIAAFKDDRKQHFAEQKFDDRMERQLENRDRSEALKLFGMAQRYGMWAKTREQVLTENERREASRLRDEEGRNTRQGLSIAQQNKIQENIDRRILEKRTATHDITGARLTAPEARRQRELTAVERDVEGRTGAITREMSIGDDGELVPSSKQRAGVNAIRAGGAFRSLPEKDRAIDSSNVDAINTHLTEKWKDPKTAPAPADQVWVQGIAADIISTNPRVTAAQAADTVASVLAPNAKEPRVLPDGRVQIGTLPPAHLSEDSMMALADLWGRRTRDVVPPPAAKSAVPLTAPPVSPTAARLAAPGRAAEAQARGSAINLDTVRDARTLAAKSVEQQQLIRELGDDYDPSMTLKQMRQAVALKRNAAIRTPGSVMRSTPRPWERR